MSTFQRIEKIIVSLIIFACALLIIIDPKDGYSLVAIIMSISLLSIAIKTLIYYFSMAIHMVGGRVILYEGIILLDLGLFTTIVANMPRTMIYIYLMLSYLITGIFKLLGALDAKRIGARWKLKLHNAVFHLVVAILCIIFHATDEAIAYVYCAGLIHSAITGIIDACKKHALVYIQ